MSENTLFYFLILFFFILVIFLVFYIIRLKYKLKIFKTELSHINSQEIDCDKKDEVVDLLTDLLNIGLINAPITELTSRMANLLKSYYKIKYVTFFIKGSDGWFNILTTNIPRYRISQTERYYNTQLKTMNTDSRVEIITGYNSNNFLSKNNIEYSNFTLIKQNDIVIGALLLEHNNKDEIESNNNNQFKLYEKIFNTTSLVLKHVIEISDIIKKVSTDQLTEVYNRRFINLTLDEEIIKHSNLGQSFHIALLDIDHFKKFNDTYGHQFGDKVLQVVCSYIKENLGSHSWVARYGGEEFLIFIANSHINRVYSKIDEIREGISKLDVFYDGQSAAVTVSFGIAGFPKNGSNQEDLIGNADKALYESKATGRNKVTVFNSES